MSNPYLLDTPAVVSFSGGRTSGYMLYHILQAFGGKLPDDVKVIFNNTGKERPETLDFVERCSQEWGVPVTWLEYRYEGEPMPPVGGHWEEREVTLWTPAHDSDDEREPVGTRLEKVWVPLGEKRKTNGKHTFVEVNYATASRNGEPFEQIIRARNMLPNVVSRFCTVELKIRTTNRYLKTLGDEWQAGYTNAIGLRADEPKRVAKLQTTNRHNREEPVAPLAAAGVTRDHVMEFWAKHPFDLQLSQDEGNCDACFLKGQGKIRRIFRNRPDLAEWWIRMETIIEGGRSGTDRFRNDRPPYRVQLQMAQQPGLYDGFGDDHDELSIACHCTD